MSNQISHSKLLADEIVKLKIKQIEEGILIKDHVRMIFDSLQPINLVKNSIYELASLPDIKMRLLSTIVGLASEFLSQRVLMAPSINPIQRMFGATLKFLKDNILFKTNV